MANYNSDRITNLEAQPAVYPKTDKSGAQVMEHDQKSITGGDAQGTTVTFFNKGDFPDGGFLDLRKSTFRFPAMGSSVTANIGIVGDATEFRSAVDVSSAGEATLFSSGDPFYEIDADDEFQLLITLSGASVSAGTKTLYVDLCTFRPA